MMRFVENPNLPDGKVRALICGTDDEKILSFFYCHGIEVLKSKPNSEIDFAVSEHADMNVLHLGGAHIILDKKQVDLGYELAENGMTVYECADGVSGCYPNDVKLNFALFGRYAFGNFKYIDKRLLQLISKKEHINVKQGYCKCSVLVLNDNSVITDDESVHRKMLENGIDSLFIEKGDVTLPGHEYGFIGGASGKIAENTVVFFGDVKKHRNSREIIAFLDKNNCKFLCTDNCELRDIGGIIPIIEDV